MFSFFLKSFCHPIVCSVRSDVDHSQTATKITKSRDTNQVNLLDKSIDSFDTYFPGWDSIKSLLSGLASFDTFFRVEISTPVSLSSLKTTGTKCHSR